MNSIHESIAIQNENLNKKKSHESFLLFEILYAHISESIEV